MKKLLNFHVVLRHYLDFINHFVKLYREKCSELEEQQLHLNVGLGKIAETVEQVEEMQKSLAVKSQVLLLGKNVIITYKQRNYNILIIFLFFHRNCKPRMTLLMLN